MGRAERVESAAADQENEMQIQREKFEQENQKRTKELVEMKATLNATVAELDARLMATEQNTTANTDALRISEEKRMTAEHELAQAEAHTGQLVNALANMAPGMMQAVIAVRNMSNTSSGQRALLNSGGNGAQILNIVQASQPLTLTNEASSSSS